MSDIKTYSLKKDGNKQITEHFKVREFAQKDGLEDEVKVDLKLVYWLELIRDSFQKPIIITSAYRTESYNHKIGGVLSSYHVKGMAVDFYIRDVDPKEVYEKLNSWWSGGLGQYRTFTHIDTRDYKTRWKKEY